MEEELKIKTINDVKGNTYTLDSVLGKGGQGMVCKTKDKHIAIKFVMKNDEPLMDEIFYEKYKEKINDVIIMKIDDDINICRPEIILEKPYSGYVMHLLSELKPISHLIYDSNSDSNFNDFFKETGSLKKRFEVLVELARTLARLHSKGIVYCDISPNNIFYSDTKNFSKVWIIDCDNLKYTYELRNGIFTPGYGAPEVESKASSNTIFSDCYSFAVLAFKVLTQRNPFETAYDSETSSNDWDATTTEKQNFSNFKKPWLFENGSSDELKDFFDHFLTKDLIELFNETFNEKGRLEPFTRPSMRQWYDVLKKTYLNLNKCSCGNYIFNGEKECPFCKEKRSFGYYGHIKNLYLEIEQAKKEVEKELNSYDFDDLDNVNNILNNKIIIKHERLTNDFIIYNNFYLFNFSIKDISICENPYPILNLSQRNGYLYVENKTSHRISYYFKRTGDKGCIFGDDTKSFHFNSKDTLQLNFKDSDTKIYRCLLVKSV